MEEKDRTDVRRTLSSWRADEGRDRMKPSANSTADDVHGIRCYRLSTWTERGILPVEWYLAFRSSRPPCPQLYAFLEAFGARSSRIPKISTAIGTTRSCRMARGS